jgi:hypothetical protein
MYSALYSGPSKSHIACNMSLMVWNWIHNCWTLILVAKYLEAQHFHWRILFQGRTILVHCQTPDSNFHFRDSDHISFTFDFFLMFGRFKTLETRSCNAELDRLYFLTAVSDLCLWHDIRPFQVFFYV